MKILCLVACMLFVAGLSAQNYVLTSDPAEVLSITGASTLHDWNVKAGEVHNLPKQMSISNNTIDLEAFEISIPVTTLDGGRGATMNNKIQKALLATEHPNVIFKLNQEQMISLSDSTAIEGELLIAGQAVTIDLDVVISSDDEQLTLTGNEPMKMSDFGIEPPSAMFGQIQTKDEITVNFELTFIKQE